MQRASVGAWIAALCLLAACSSRANAPKSVELNGFERVPDPALLKRQFDVAEAIKRPSYPGHDFDVATSGYAKLSAVTKEDARKAKDKALYQFIQGKTAAKVRFTVPGDYKKKGEYPKVWETGFGISIDSRSPLGTTDWSTYKYLSLRVYNPGPLEQSLNVRFSDSASGVTTVAVVVPLGESELEMPLEVLAAARLNPSDMKAVNLYLDSVSQTIDPVLIVDALSLQDTDAALRAKLAAEEGDSSDEEDDWDSEDEDVVRQVKVVRPGQVLAPAEATSISGPASAR